jgi:uncharacterized protein
VDQQAKAVGPLDDDECRALLKTVTSGRLALSVRALPVVLTVNYLVQEPRLILSVTSGAGVRAACDGTVVAFQVDGIDVPSETGWNVLVQGRARLLQTGAELVAAEEALSMIWADPDTNIYVSLGIDLMTGHRLGRGPSGSGLALTGSRGPG